MKHVSRWTGFRNIEIMDAEETSKYVFNCRQGDVLGTRVPISTLTGGISGSKKVFGHVVVGEQVRSLMPLKPRKYTPKWLSALQRDFDKTKAKSARLQRRTHRQEPVVESTRFALSVDLDLGAIVLAVQNQRQAEIALRASKEPWIQMIVQPYSDVMMSEPYPKLSI